MNELFTIGINYVKFFQFFFAVVLNVVVVVVVIIILPLIFQRMNNKRSAQQITYTELDSFVKLFKCFLFANCKVIQMPYYTICRLLCFVFFIIYSFMINKKDENEKLKGQ